MQITFSRTGMESMTLDIIPGTLRLNDECVDAGDSSIPKIRNAKGASGSCSVLIDDENFTYEKAVLLISPAGAGSTSVTGAATCHDAIVDVSITGSGVQTASISWKGAVSAGNS